MDIGMKVIHKKFGFGTVVNAITDRPEYAEETIVIFKERYGETRNQKLPDLFEILFENEEKPRKFAESAMYVFFTPADETVDEDTGEIID